MMNDEPVVEWFDAEVRFEPTDKELRRHKKWLEPGVDFLPTDEQLDQVAEQAIQQMNDPDLHPPEDVIRTVRAMHNCSRADALRIISRDIAAIRKAQDRGPL